MKYRSLTRCLIALLALLLLTGCRTDSGDTPPADPE